MGEAMTQVNAGNTAPDFSVKGVDGKAYLLDDLLQKGPVIAAFFKVSCPICQFTFPFLERLYQRYGGKGVTFVGISQDDVKSTNSFAREYGTTFPMAIDEKEKGYLASNAYGLTMVPTIFLIDTDKNVRVSSMGFVKSDLEQIAKELSERIKIPPAALFQANEAVPANRPG
jgi:peroxiredoxin